MAKQQLVSSTTKKWADIAELEMSDKGQVYVVNRLQGKSTARILVTVPKLNGNGQDLVRIPATTIPIDLTLQVTKQQLMASSEFRKTCSKGLIKLVDVAYARQLLKTTAAKEELRRISEEEANIRAVLQNNITRDAASEGATVLDIATDDDDEDADTVVKQATPKKTSATSAVASKPKSDVDLDVADSDEEEDSVPEKTVKKLTANEVGPKFKALIETFIKDRWSQTEIIAKFKEKKMKASEVKHAKTKLRDFPKVTKYLSSL